MNIIKFLILSTGLIRCAFGNPAENPDDPFSSWENVPELINSLQLEQLQRLTLIKLGYPQASQGLSDKEHQLYMDQTKERWREWWKSTGEEIAKSKKTGARIDPEAFKIAWNFLGKDREQPKVILPVWIPETWTLTVTFTNGDYGGREKEVWMIDRKTSGVNLTRLRGDYGENWGDWNVAITKFDGLTPERADHYLKALCYIHHYAPATDTKVPENELGKLYYPHATLHLRDGSNRILWNTDGYDFLKTRPESGNGEAGRSYYFLKTVFSNHENWKTLSSPTSEELAPYRSLLSASKPYFFTNASDIIQLFGQNGSHLEKESMLEWAEKQKAATNATMGWKVRSSDFSTAMKINVINFTKPEQEETLKQIKKLEKRLAKDGDNRQGEQPTDGKPTDADQPLLKSGDNQNHQSPITTVITGVREFRSKNNEKLPKATSDGVLDVLKHFAGTFNPAERDCRVPEQGPKAALEPIHAVSFTTPANENGSVELYVFSEKHSVLQISIDSKVKKFFISTDKELIGHFSKVMQKEPQH